MQDIRVAALQLESVAGDKDANFRKLARFAEEAKGRGVEILVAPECGLTGYWFLRHLTVPQLAALAERVPDGPMCHQLLALAAKHRMTIGAGLLEAGDDMVVADLDASLLEKATGRLWMQARRPELYGELTIATGRERDAHQLKFEE